MKRRRRENLQQVAAMVAEAGPDVLSLLGKEGEGENPDPAVTSSDIESETDDEQISDELTNVAICKEPVRRSSRLKGKQ
ncbi:hypothetical protein O1611_g1232 [Lasiodiplodia mahajangana]|uniref:Uncharacterized protein n=1 Tax=Lasiodiplodia mahajangana TaxID=1108764 RepID=A0ACC2JY33_9PEZI|nr:hypothetical protein O1611_g1232 [Lasiodiplodia mahajangana]